MSIKRISGFLREAVRKHSFSELKVNAYSSGKIISLATFPENQKANVKKNKKQKTLVYLGWPLYTVFSHLLNLSCADLVNH